jgi:amino acid adenylation domain-containing protein
LPGLPEDERQRVLVEWNATAVDYVGEQAVHRLFERQVERTPDAIALVYEGQHLTFRDLNRRANQLARHLRRLSVGPETLVGVGMERSPTMVVGLLGILKAGGAYVPLDPAYPAERLAFMLADARPAVLLTRESLLARFPACEQVVCLDTGWSAIAQESDGNVSGDVGGDNLLYALYTSGSTGQPKGVAGTHRAAINRFCWMWATYPFEPGEVCCQKTSLSFVDSVWEIFGPLLQGIPLVIIPDMVVRDSQQLIQTLAAHAVTRIVLVPSLLRALLEMVPDMRRRLPGLKYWVCSGEALPVELALRFRERMPQSVLLNLYGSSEVAADVTCYDMREYQPSLASIPIGRPIANTRIYVLDEQMQPVPVGVPGELYAGGDGLARGYLHRPALTAARFVPDPFSGKAGARLYRTGDRVRYLPDGNIEYLGRLDHQVKLRGMRVELGEIESVLLRHPAVRQVVVMAREDVPGATPRPPARGGPTIPDGSPGDANVRSIVEPPLAGGLGEIRLIAYIVSREEQPATPDELRSHALQYLPDYMLPSAFVMLAALPLTPNGKVDRQALPVPAQNRPALPTPFVAPRSPLEESIAAIWSELLEVAQVGIHDNFFALGGHSLLATQVIARLRAIFGVEVPLQGFLDAPTVDRLAVLLEQSQKDVPTRKSPLKAVSREAYRISQAGMMGRG